MRYLRSHLPTVFVLAAIVLPACSSVTSEEGTARTSDGLAGASQRKGAVADAGSNVQRALAYGKSLIGTPYGWWMGGGIPEGSPMWAASGPAPAASSVDAANCAGLTNLMLRSVGREVPGYGGTGSYGDYYWDVAEWFDASRSYPPGTLLGRYYRDVVDQGHVAVVIEDGYVLQSYANSYGGSYPGVNDWATVAASHAGYYYEYAVLPENWLGGGGGGTEASECAYGDGYYCGGNGVTGDANTLYACSGGTATRVQVCATGCSAEAAGTDDACSSSRSAERKDCAYGDGMYCGGNGVTGDRSTLYRCTGGTASVEKRCPDGCRAEAMGVDDGCEP